MKPKNHKERRSSLLKFIAMFLVTTAVIVAAVYFNFKIPMEENAQLRDRVSKYEQGADFQLQFYHETQAIKEMIDSLEPGDDQMFEQQEIASRIVKLKSEIPATLDAELRDQFNATILLFDDLLDNKILALKTEETDAAYKDLLERYQNTGRRRN